MPQYKYKALNIQGKTISGTLSAANDIDLENKLSSLGLDIIDSKEVRDSSLAISKALSLQDLVMFCVQMEQLERAGVPLLDSISDLRDTSDNYYMKNLMADIHDSINRGNMLSKALSEHPKYFDEVFIGLVAAGEKTGDLADVFHHLGEHLKWVDEIRRKIKQASYYPSFLLLLMGVVLSVMMIFVIPQLSKFLLAQGFDLPSYTVALISTSKFFENHFLKIFAIPIGIIFTIKILCRMSENINYTVDDLLLRLPRIGNVIRKIEMARFCRFLSITYRSGIGILDCLDISSNVVQNVVIKEAILMVRKSVSEGNSLTSAIKMTNQFPQIVVRMIKVGEDSGLIDETLKNVNFFFDKEVTESVNAMIGMIQPTLTIILGGIMMWISIAVFGPLYSSFSKMQF